MRAPLSAPFLAVCRLSETVKVCKAFWCHMDLRRAGARGARWPSPRHNSLGLDVWLQFQLDADVYGFFASCLMMMGFNPTCRLHDWCCCFQPPTTHLLSPTTSTRGIDSSMATRGSGSLFISADFRSVVVWSRRPSRPRSSQVDFLRLALTERFLDRFPDWLQTRRSDYFPLQYIISLPPARFFGQIQADSFFKLYFFLDLSPQNIVSFL